MPKKRHPLDIRVEEELNEATCFTVNFFLARAPTIFHRGKWERHDFPVTNECDRPTALKQARALVAERGPDAHGRRGMIYAICGPVTNHVSDDFCLNEETART